MIPRKKNISLIHTFQEKYDIQSLCVHGINIWPLVMFELNKPYTNSTQSNKKDLVLMSIKEIMSFFRMQWLSIKDKKNNSRKSAFTDVIFLTQSTRRTKIGSVYYDRICDPFIDAIKTNSLKCHTFEWSYDHRYKTPRHNSSEFIQIGIEAAIMRSFISKPLTIEGLQLLETMEFVEILRRHNFTHNQFIKNIDLAIRQIFQLRLFFVKKLSRTKAKLAFFFPYYGIVSFAFNLACKNLGIKTVEIQHGFYGKDTYLQNGYRNLKKKLYLLPDIIWCWEKRDEEAISHWSKEKSILPVTFTGGNLWNNLWLNSSETNSTFVKNTQFKLANIKEKNKITILVTLAPDLNVPKWLIDYISNCHTDVFWLIRFHHNTPKSHKMIIKSWFSKNPNTEYNFSNQYPLPALLRFCDIHLTINSSSVIEAESLAVPSLIVSELGCELFDQQIKNGWAHPATDKKALNILLNTNKSQPDSLKGTHRIAETVNNIDLMKDFLKTHTT